MNGGNKDAGLTGRPRASVAGSGGAAECQRPPWFERISRLVTRWAGSTAAMGVAASIIVLWLITGPFFGYSDTWQLVINTGTTVITFLMVFLIQRSQNRDAMAVQLKLNEIIAALQGASNRLVDVEDLSELDLDHMHAHYARMAEAAKHERDIRQSHSIEDSEPASDKAARPGTPAPAAAQNGGPVAAPRRP